MEVDKYEFPCPPPTEVNKLSINMKIATFEIWPNNQEKDTLVVSGS